MIVACPSGRLKWDIAAGDGLHGSQKVGSLRSGQSVVVLNLEQRVGRSSTVGDNQRPGFGCFFGTGEVAGKVVGLKKLLAEAELEKAMLKDLAEGNF